MTDTQGRPLHVEITPGQQHDVTMAEHLLEYVKGQAFIADAGYDSNKVIAAVKAKGLTPVISSNPCRKEPLAIDKEIYGLRYNVERFFQHTEALSPNCHAIRKDSPKLHGLSPSFMCLDLGGNDHLTSG